MTFGEKIIGLRKKKKLTQSELAELLNVSPRALWGWEAENSRPRNKEMYHKLADVLDCSVNYLLMEDETSASADGDEEWAHIQNIMEQAKVYFAGAKLPESDRRQFMLDIQEIYWQQKLHEDKD